MKISIFNKGDRSRFLSLDTKDGPIEESDAIKFHEPKFGFYVKNNLGYVGAFSSNIGPVMFINEMLFPFREGSWSTEVTKSDEENIFSFFSNGRGPVHISYEPIKLNPADAWADEMFEDIYQWVGFKRNDPSIMKLWTDDAVMI